MYSTQRFPSPRFTTLDLARWTVPVAAWAAIRSLLVVQSDPAAQAETRFLAFWVAAVLMALAGLTATPARRSGELLWTAVLATAVAWIAPPAPLRGALVGLVLVLGLLVAAGRTWLDAQGRCTTAGRLGPGTLVPLALACQLLARVDLLLPPLLDLRTLVSVLVLPAVSGIALSVLALRMEGRRVLLVATTVVVLSPGWNVSTTLCFVALATGSLLASPPEALRQIQALRRWLRPLGFLVLGLIALWNFPVGGLASLAGLVVFGGRKVAAVAVALAALLAFFHHTASGDGTTVHHLGVFMVWLGGVALVPAVFLAPRDDRWQVICGLMLALAGAFTGIGPEALAAGLALAASGLPVRGAGATLQCSWSSLVAVASLLLAAYPWVRERPREDFLVLLGLGGSAILIPLVLMVILSLLFEFLSAKFGDQRNRPEWVVGGLLLGVAVFSAGPSTVLVDNYQAKVLNTQRKGFRQSFPEQQVSTVVVDSNLVQGLVLPPGTVVGSIRLRAAEQQRLHRWVLKVGTHTGEWAAARPDVALHPNLKTPRAWLSQLAPDGTFFSRRYRARLHLPEAVNASSFELTLQPNLAPGVQLVVYRVELRP